jgi:hypothetical protein
VGSSRLNLRFVRRDPGGRASAIDAVGAPPGVDEPRGRY